MQPFDLLVMTTVIAGVAIAAAIDLRTRRVPNPLQGASEILRRVGCHPHLDETEGELGWQGRWHGAER